MGKRKDLCGKRFGRLVVIKLSHINKFNRQVWICKCECGTSKSIDQNNLVSGTTASCGCLGRERLLAANTKHGMAGTPIYRSWNAMMRRCYNPKDSAYHNYGGRGIYVCDEWQDVTNFIRDMAPSHKQGLEIDRINNDGNYSPCNCRWATSKEQANNKRTNKFVYIGNDRLTLKQCAEKIGIKYVTLQRRINVGMSLFEAISNPVRKWSHHAA